LREALADPLLVIVLAPDGLAPPLVRQLVGQEECRVVVEAHRIVPPHEVRRYDRVEYRKVRGTVSARPLGLGEGQREAGIRHVAEDRRIVPEDRRGILDGVAYPARLAGIRAHDERDFPGP
jgi:hypothetical protein